MGTVTTSIERPLTEPELAGLGKQQARLLQDIGELLMQKKVAIDEFKAAIGEKQKQIEELSARINLGLDRQEVECDVLFETPEKGRKSFVAVATGQIIKVEDMISADYQSRLFDPDELPENETGSSNGLPE
ncbi:MAG: hypothetical protein JO033_23985 [Acidobacteriaceae bacterium]|nr:hypothetical protein [Acidobacteriaceae bacterium]